MCSEIRNDGKQNDAKSIEQFIITQKSRFSQLVEMSGRDGIVEMATQVNDSTNQSSRS
jgi:hypothetical protein